MKHYEVLFILKPTLTEEEVNAKLEFVKEVLVKIGIIKSCIVKTLQNPCL